MYSKIWRSELIQKTHFQSGKKLRFFSSFLLSNSLLRDFHCTSHSLNSSKFLNLNSSNSLILRKLKSPLNSSNLRNFNSSNSFQTANNYLKLLLFGSTFAFVIYEFCKDKLLFVVNAEQLKQDELAKQYGKFDKKLKTITIDELQNHNSKEKRIWVAFREGVYDLTDFVDQHPGGKILLIAAGNRIDPFWSIYANHKTKKTLELLETYRIANIELDKSFENSLTTNGDTFDPFANDPPRNSMLKVHTLKPFNAEAPAQFIGKDFLTPNEIFFVRNHLPVPEIDENDYRLEITGVGLDKTYKFTLDDLKALPKHDLICSIQCAGNRRKEFTKYGEVKGLLWEKGAISNAKWTGVYLVDVLNSINCEMKNKNIKHIICEGYDFDPSSAPYSASVQSEFALDPNNHVLIAYKMNDQDIPRDHGYPVRFVAPGVCGARNVKWLNKIILSKEEADSHWQRRDYKSFTPEVDYSNVDFVKGYSIQKLPVQSAICEPHNYAKIPIQEVLDNNCKIRLDGYATSGCHKIIRVDVSKCSNENDKDLKWICAKLFGEEEFNKKLELDDKLRKGLITVNEHSNQCESLKTDLMKQDSFKSYSWVLWTAELEIDKNELKKGNKLVFICKATDSSYNTQPETAKSIFNFRGVLNNSWHRIEIEFV